MAEKTTYIRIDRNIKQWRWWYDHNTLIVFLCILIDANIVEHGFSGQKIKRGQLATSLQSLCNSTGLTIQQIRTALSHLKSTGEITSKKYNKFQVITVVNYDKYQDLTGRTPYKKQATNNQPTSNQQQLEKGEKGEKERRKKGRFAPNSPSGEPQRGTDLFRNQSHLLLKRDEGTVDDIPENYRNGTYQSFTDFGEYWDWRNQ